MIVNICYMTGIWYMIVIIWLADKNWNWNGMEFVLKLFGRNGAEIAIEIIERMKIWIRMEIILRE